MNRASVMILLSALLGASIAPTATLAQRRRAAPTETSSPNDAIARQHFQVGSNYYDAGDYDDALREFLRAYELSHRAQLYYNISLCYQQLSDLPNAIDYLQRYLQEVAEVPNRANLELRLQNLRERDAEARAQRERAAAQSQAQPVTVPPQESSTQPPPPTTQPSEVTAPPSDAPSNSGALHPGAITGFVAAGVGVVGAALFGILALSENGALSSGCGMTRTCTDAQTSNLRTFGLLFDVSLGVALVGAIVGTVFLFVGNDESPQPTEAARLRWQPRLGANDLGLHVDGTF